MTAKLSKGIAAALLADAQAQAAAYAAPYLTLAESLARNIAAADTVKGKVWDGFKSALEVASEAGHTPTALRAGLEIACTEAEIPAGSFRGYIGTIGNLYADIKADKLSLDDALALSVADARKRYKVEPVLTDVQKLQKHIAEGIKDWTAEQLAVLASIVDDMQPQVEPEAETEEVETEREAVAA